MTGAQPASNRFAADAQGSSDAAECHPLLAQAHRFLKAGVPAPLGVQRPLFGLGDRQPGILTAGCIKGIVAGGRFGGGSDLSRLIEVTMMVIEHTAERITAVAQQMPPVGDLNGLRRSLAGSIGVGAGPIADDDLDRRMVLEPRGQGLGPGSRSTRRPRSRSQRIVP